MFHCEQEENDVFIKNKKREGSQSDEPKSCTPISHKGIESHLFMKRSFLSQKSSIHPILDRKFQTLHLAQ